MYRSVSSKGIGYMCRYQSKGNEALQRRNVFNWHTWTNKFMLRCPKGKLKGIQPYPFQCFRIRHLKHSIPQVQWNRYQSHNSGRCVTEVNFWYILPLCNPRNGSVTPHEHPPWTTGGNRLLADPLERPIVLNLLPRMVAAVRIHHMACATSSIRLGTLIMLFRMPGRRIPKLCFTVVGFDPWWQLESPARSDCQEGFRWEIKTRLLFLDFAILNACLITNGNTVFDGWLYSLASNYVARAARVYRVGEKDILVSRAVFFLTDSGCVDDQLQNTLRHASSFASA